MEVILPAELPPVLLGGKIYEKAYQSYFRKFLDYCVRREIAKLHADSDLPSQVKQLFTFTKKSNADSLTKKESFVIPNNQFIDIILFCRKINFRHKVYDVEWQTEQSKHDLEKFDEKIRQKNEPLSYRELNAGFKDRKMLTIHLFESLDNNKNWHIFYFDQEDLLKFDDNHWKPNGVGTPHIHYTSHLHDSRATPGKIITALKKERQANVSHRCHIRYGGSNIVSPSIDDILIFGKPYLCYADVERGEISLHSPDSVVVGY